ncbi:MAG: diacylglycerol/lipid kinase family protein [Gammaproteobacteria bacterium]
MTDTLIVCNPASGRVKKQLPQIRKLMASTPQVTYAEADGPQQLAACFREHDVWNKRLLIVVGGDGTFHAVLTLLFGNGDHDHPPLLALVAGGTTNMTAADFGIRGKPCQVLRRLLAGAGDIESRSITRYYLKVHHRGQTLCGMFLGNGLIAAGVRYYQTKLAATGVTGETLPGLVYARFLLAWLLGKTRVPATESSIRVEGETRFTGPAALTLVSTLQRLLLGCRPYWGDGQSPLKLTSVREKPQALLRSLLPVMFGRGERLDPASYMSLSARMIELDFNGDFIIDGELYSTDSGLQISSGEFTLARL